MDSAMYMSIGDSEEAVICSPRCLICDAVLGDGTGPDVPDAKANVYGFVEIHFRICHPDIDVADVSANITWEIS